MLEILVNGERSGRVWKKARSIQVRDPDNPEGSVADISLSHYHKNQCQVYIHAWENTRLDIELHQYPGEEELNVRALNSKFWSFDPYGGEYSREGGQAKKLENLVKARDLLNNLIARVEAKAEENPGETRVIETTQLGQKFRNIWTKAQMIQGMALTDPEEIERTWGGAPGDLTQILGTKERQDKADKFSKAWAELEKESPLMGPIAGPLTPVKDQEEVPEKCQGCLATDPVKGLICDEACTREVPGPADLTPVKEDQEAKRDTSDLVGSSSWIENELGPIDKKVLDSLTDSPEEEESRPFTKDNKSYSWTRDEMEFQLMLSGDQADKLWADSISEVKGWKCPLCHSDVPETKYCMNCGKDMGGVNGYE